MKREFLPWELNHLRKYGFSEAAIGKLGDIPVEYATGHASFRDLDLYITPDCLIPRLETEEMVDLCLKLIKANPKDSLIEIADIGCGTGALGIAIANELDKLKINNFHLTLSDISDKALKITKKNVTALIPHLQNKISILESDLLSDYPKNIKIDYLLANLPYIPSSRIPTLDTSVKDYEPILALDGGPDGTQLINKLLHQIISYLSDNPILIFEIDSTHKLKDFSIPSGLKGEIKKDQFEKTRFLIIHR